MVPGCGIWRAIAFVKMSWWNTRFWMSVDVDFANCSTFFGCLLVNLCSFCVLTVFEVAPLLYRINFFWQFIIVINYWGRQWETTSPSPANVRKVMAHEHFSFVQMPPLHGHHHFARRSGSSKKVIHEDQVVLQKTCGEIFSSIHTWRNCCLLMNHWCCGKDD